MNEVRLSGRLTRDPEIKVLDIGGHKVTVANFSLAVTRYFRKANGERDKDTTFVNCEAWDTGAETLGKYVTKGDPILVFGSLKTENWEKDGQKMSRMKVRVSNFERLFKNTNPTETSSEIVTDNKEQF
jgi:single-strand DNA-binding protein